ncbi:anthranilate synthase component I family protein [Saccharopolyspora indica]|uniref:anthranilate synthase component I family protein n=1 Tax=Saccharopolyspora indica TaxID=1229659 RepID=UPI0022EA230F|nr:anthranilate synthase component I family protein [Saccharopolyspora indica]MDA3647026.1 anthranilate synthase component I family protein [Saccharopolyspora indica]
MNLLEKVRVRTESRVIEAPADPLSAYCALAARFGREQVYLLESAAGPQRDVRHEFIGFGELLTVSVTRSLVRVTGIPVLRDGVRERMAPLLVRGADGWRLREPRDLWPVLRVVQGMFDTGEAPHSPGFGFLAHLGYDAARYIEDLPYLIDQEPELPDVHLALHQGCVVTDLDRRTSRVLVHSGDGWPELDADGIAELVAQARTGPANTTAIAAESVHDDTTRESYLSDVERCHEHIAAGDIYQVQLGHEIAVTSSLDPSEVYRRLRHRNASPYMYLTHLAGHTVVGASPELFVQVEDGTVTMRPIAGTVPRHGVADEVAARRLRADAKELAEHTMLVDLCRNDIGRICLPNSLDVPSELVVERFSHVQHLVSTVVGRAAEDTDVFDIIAALFPAGTVTGAPKIRAMEIIEELESSRRGLYAGAVGLIGCDGYANLALCIRTLIHSGDVYRTRASAGVVADSDAGREWVETLAKSSAAYWAVTGQELL